MNNHSSLARLIWGLVVVVLAGSVVAWGWARYNQQHTALAELPVYGPVRDSAPGSGTLIERSGRPFTLSELTGQVWIVNFFFSQCTELCPRTMAQMARLQKALADATNVRLVSITVDPEHDTPSVLAEFAGRFDAQPDRWFFLSGDKRAIYDLSLNTFHMAVEEIPPGLRKPGDDPVRHDGHFVLVDWQAQIRGYYDGLDEAEQARLLQDVQSLLKEKTR